MNRLWAAALGATLFAAACKIERTPQEFVDHRLPAESEREAAAEELRDRILALGQALERGSAAEAMIALSPTADAHVLSPAAGPVLTGAEQIAAALESVAAAPVSVEMREVQVFVGPRANIAWFHAMLRAPGRPPEWSELRLTGVYVRIEGNWRLVQAHLSTPIRLQGSPERSPAADADSLEAG